MATDSKKRALLLGGGTQALVIARALRRKGREVHIFDDDRWSYSYHTRYAERKVIAPSPADEEAYCRFLKEYVAQYAIDVVVPMNDATAQLLAHRKAELSACVAFIMPDFEVFEAGYNKLQLMRLCEECNFPHPRSLDLEVASAAAENFVYPALIKPNHMTGGRGMTLVGSYEEFCAHYAAIRAEYGACHLQEFIPPGGRQLKVQIFMHNGAVYASSVIHKQRFYPENGGSSCCNISIEDAALVELCGQVLGKLGWEGFADFDLVEDARDGVVKIMEINPRVPACLKSVVESGVDYANMIVNASLGEPLPEYEYRPGHSLRHIGFEVLWFLYSKSRFTSRPSWFRFFGRRLSFQDFSWSDPLPFIVGTIGNIRKQLSPEFRKSKAGLR